MRRAILILVGVVLALILAELLLRLTGFGLVSPRLQFDVNTRSGLEQGAIVVDRELFWRQADGTVTGLDRALNMVHPDDPVPPLSQRLRIIVLGDSCTRLFGDGLPYSALLEQQLGPDRVEVYNASLPGYTSHQGLAWLREQLLAFRPDLVVIYFGWNDHWRTTGLTDRQYAASLKPGSLRLLHLLRGPAHPPPLRVPVSEYAENLRQIAVEVAASGAQSLFVLAPYHFTPENVARLLENHFIAGGDDVLRLHRQYLRAARGAATATVSEVCDAAAVFAYVDRPQQLLQRDGIHLTDTGHDALAVTLADLIVRNYLSGVAPTADRTVPNALAAVPALAAVARHEAAQGKWAEAVVTHRRAVAAAPAAFGPRLGLAWLLATCPVDSVRDGTEALELLRPVADPESKLVQYFDVAAAASAEAGQFDQAVAQAGRALELAAKGRASDAADSPLLRGLRTRLSLYESGRPYRLPGTPADGQ